MARRTRGAGDRSAKGDLAFGSCDCLADSILICGSEPLQPGEWRLHWFLLSEAALHGVAFSWKL